MTRSMAAMLAVACVVVTTAQIPTRRPFGFSRSGAETEQRLERRFLSLPNSNRIKDAHAFLTAKPHVAGSARDKELADWTAARFTEAGLEDVRISTHEVLVPWPLEVSVEMTAPRAWRASMREDAIDGDVFTQASTEEIGLPYHAYSASGDVTADVVYAGSGNPADYD